MSYWVAGGTIVGGALSGMGAASAGDHYGGGFDYMNTAARDDIERTLGNAADIYGRGAYNDLMNQGYAGAANIGNAMAPYLDYGSQMLGYGMGGMQGAGAMAGQMAGFDPTQFNAQYQAGGAYGPQYSQGVYDQVMSNAQSAINPMLQSIGQMNARAFNEQQLPGMAGQAIGSGNTASSKWGLNNAVLARGVADANARAGTQLYGNANQQAAQLGGEYGINAADAANAMQRLNTQYGNQLNFTQAGNNAQQRLDAMNNAGNMYGNITSQANPYFSSMTQLLQQIPQYQVAMGQNQQQAPLNLLDWYQKSIMNVGNAGAPGGAPSSGGGSTMDAIGRGAAAGGQIGGGIGDIWTNWNAPPVWGAGEGIPGTTPDY